MHHIRATLPDIKACITSQLQKYNVELQSLGGPLGNGNSSSIVLNIITEFMNEFLTVIDGNMNDLSLNELSSGAHISFMFHELFSNGVKSIHPVPCSHHSSSQFLRPQVSSITSVSANKIPLLYLKHRMGTQWEYSSNLMGVYFDVLHEIATYNTTLFVRRCSCRCHDFLL